MARYFINEKSKDDDDIGKNSMQSDEDTEIEMANFNNNNNNNSSNNMENEDIPDDMSDVDELEANRERLHEYDEDEFAEDAEFRLPDGYNINNPDVKIKTYPTSGNFLIAKFPKRAKEIEQKLKENGILVRDRSNYPLLKDCLRIGIGTVKQTQQFLAVLKETL